MDILTEIRDAVLRQGGVVVCFIYALRAGHKQVWRWDREVKAVEALLAAERVEKTYWRDIAMEALNDGQRAAAHALKEARP